MGAREFDGWSSFGAGDLVTTLPVVLDAITRDLINVRVPENSRVRSIEARVNTIAGGATTVTMNIFRDSGGDDLFYAGGAQTLVTGTTTATDGGTTWAVDRDHHPGTGSSVAARTGWPQNRYVNLWVSLILNAGTANLEAIVINWAG